jgi:hypothetical protein
MRNSVLLLVFATMSAAFGLTSVYRVEPKRADYAGWTDTMLGRRHVSEVVTLNVDSLGPGHCELFSGQGCEQEFYVSVRTYPGPGQDQPS